MDQKLAKKRLTGFTLSELLIALAILGIIATFTIPKVLQSQQDTKNKAIAKEVASMISASYQAYQQANGGPSPNLGNLGLTPYMNFVKYDTVTTIDGNQTQTTQSCATVPCILLHNGARLSFWRPSSNFGGSGTTNTLFFDLDPDGKVTDGGSGDASATAPGKSIHFLLYYNGRMTTWKNMEPGTTNSAGIYPACTTCDPPWFNWD